MRVLWSGGLVAGSLPSAATLAALPAGVRVGLLSNNYPVVSDHLRADPRFARFDALVFSNELGHKKPAPEAFAALETAMERPAAQTAFVDDVQENIDAANAAGFHGLLYHHEAHAAFAASSAREVVGPDNVDADTAPLMGAEDFSFMLERRPGAYIFVGNGDTAGVHNPGYDFNDEALAFGASFWARLVESGARAAA